LKCEKTNVKALKNPEILIPIIKTVDLLKEIKTGFGKWKEA
jgi:hypothetical protein